MNRNQKIIFAIIILLAAFLIFFRLGRQDMLGDDGHYALRAYGYFDYMASRQQTTPLQWFGERPGWSYLSFHDHPPLYFFIQHIFFKLFGASAVVARLTSALAGLGSVLVIFLLGRRFGGVGFGLLAAGFLVLNNYFLWTARIGNLESLFIFWLLLSLWYLDKALRDDPRHFLRAGLFFGFTMLTKYTLLFFLPAVFLYLLWRGSFVFREKKFWLGVAVFVLAVSPLLIYNLNMYYSRGHFDVQWSDFFGQEHEDWTILQSRVGGWHFNAREVVKNLADGLSWPYFSFVAAGLVAAIYRGRREPWLLLAASCFIFPLLFFSYIGAARHWLAVAAPFAAMLAAILWQQLLRYRPVLWLMIPPAIFFLVVIWNTNHAIAASQNSFFTTGLRVENFGYNQLDRKVENLAGGKAAPERVREMVAAWWFQGISPAALPFARTARPNAGMSSLIVYDANTAWFPAVWTFGRQRVYNGVLVMSSLEFGQVLRDEEARRVLISIPDRIYYIHAGSAVRRLAGTDYSESDILRSAYEKGISPEIIYDKQGREAFYIYESSTLNL